MNTKYRVEILKDGKWRKCYGYSISPEYNNKKGWTRNLEWAKQLRDNLSNQYPNAKYRIVAKYILE